MRPARGDASRRVDALVRPVSVESCEALERNRAANASSRSVSLFVLALLGGSWLRSGELAASC